MKLTKGCQPALGPECCATLTNYCHTISKGFPKREKVNNAAKSAFWIRRVPRLHKTSTRKCGSCGGAGTANQNALRLGVCEDCVTSRADMRKRCQTKSAVLDLAQPSLGALRALRPGPWRGSHYFVYLYGRPSSCCSIFSLSSSLPSLSLPQSLVKTLLRTSIFHLPTSIASIISIQVAVHFTMHSATSPSLAATAVPKAPQFLRLSAPLESEKRSFLVLTAKVTPAAPTEDQLAASATDSRPRSESVVSTSSDVSSTNGIQRWVSNIDVPEEATF
ncbi:hypothetical protein V1520DRAFT_338431 [Lipomyces starkeyi]|uniref:Uncharacterized protein n=1 Tax=Lipomyces starkeyi NRRL Y-11557 TaxID=675824 RepID=A0A1E3PYX7_LIPST|nr:hypothetical protein LIPSTDRAFT_75111 [Lipomyces starkeyi NRRL Y-11557]